MRAFSVVLQGRNCPYCLGPGASPVEAAVAHVPNVLGASRVRSFVVNFVPRPRQVAFHISSRRRLPQSSTPVKQHKRARDTSWLPAAPFAQRAGCDQHPDQPDSGALSALHVSTASLPHREPAPAITMSTPNGTLTPPPLPAAPSSPSLSPTKRKRTDTDASLPNGAPKKAPAQLVNGASRPLQPLLDDLLSLLKRYAALHRLSLPYPAARAATTPLTRLCLETERSAST